MRHVSRNWLAALVALPAFLVPVIEVPLVLWARHSFLELHPDYLDDPPTISRSINDPSVGGPFATFILIITALILAVLPVLIWAYARAIMRVKLSPAKRLSMLMMLFLVVVCQVLASTGMVMTTQFTFAIDHHLHMLGSYVFFVSQAVTILIAATLCRALMKLRKAQGIAEAHWPFRPSMHRFRFRFALVIVALAVLYGALFVLKDHDLAVSAYAVQVAYTQCEVVVISCFVLFLGSYGVDIHAMVRNGRLGRVAVVSAEVADSGGAKSRAVTNDAGVGPPDTAA